MEPQGQQPIPEIRLSNHLHAHVISQAVCPNAPVSVGLWFGASLDQQMEVGITDQREEATSESKKIFLLRSYQPLPYQTGSHPLSSNGLRERLCQSSPMVGFVRFRRTGGGQMANNINPSLEERRIAYKLMRQRQAAAAAGDEQAVATAVAPLIFTLVRCHFDENRLRTQAVYFLVTAGSGGGDEGSSMVNLHFRRIPVSVMNLGRERRLPYDSSVNMIVRDAGLANELSRLWKPPNAQYAEIKNFCQNFKQEHINQAIGQLALQAGPQSAGATRPPSSDDEQSL